MTPQSPSRILVVAADSLVASSLCSNLARLPGGAARAERVPTIADAESRLAADLSYDAVLVELSSAGAAGLGRLAHPHGDDSRPVLGVLRRDCAPRAVEALRAGVQECLVLGELTPDRLERALRHAIERQRVQRTLADLALRDELTGLYNRRGLMALGEHLRRQCLRGGRSLAAVAIDLDGLKTINDRLGHQAGDRALVAAAEILKRTFRDSDIVGRLGGDEFVALAQDADAAAARRIVGRLERAVSIEQSRRDAALVLGFSVGVSVLSPHRRTALASLLAGADRRMYAQKRVRQASGWTLESREDRRPVAALAAC